MRVDTWRFTEWVAFDYNTSTPNWSVLYGRELYDHSDSPVPKDWAMEHENVAGKPAMAAQVAALSKTLRRCAVRPDVCF